MSRIHHSYIDLAGHVEAVLRYAHGPQKGEVYQKHVGKNVITAGVKADSSPALSGRGYLRRVIVPPEFAGSIAGEPAAVIRSVRLGSGTTAEDAADEGVETPVTDFKDVSSVVFEVTGAYVTFNFNFAENEANTTISEAGLYTGFGRRDFIARKTFGSFTKTSDFTLEIRWQIRFG